MNDTTTTTTTTTTITSNMNHDNKDKFGEASEDAIKELAVEDGALDEAVL